MANVTTTGAAAPVNPFQFGRHSVRVIIRDDDPWFVAKDVCDALGYMNSRGALADHLDPDEKGVVNADTLGGQQKMQVINESGLYALVLRSRKPQARQFAKWVTGEVLPSIRKSGSYRKPGTAHEFRPGDHLIEAKRKFLQLINKLPDGPGFEIGDSEMRELADGYLAYALSMRRWLVSFDHMGRMQQSPVPDDAFVFSRAELQNLIRDNDARLDDQQLVQIVVACVERLAANVRAANEVVNIVRRQGRSGRVGDVA